ncbi:uncharacterized protein C8A04DRAFT_14894, partial [Dichotomopilus funicola]
GQGSFERSKYVKMSAGDPRVADGLKYTRNHVRLTKNLLKTAPLLRPANVTPAIGWHENEVSLFHGHTVKHWS